MGTQKRIAFKLTRKTKYAKKCAIKVTKVKKACHPKMRKAARVIVIINRWVRVGRKAAHKKNTRVAKKARASHKKLKAKISKAKKIVQKGQNPKSKESCLQDQTCSSPKSQKGLQKTRQDLQKGHNLHYQRCQENVQKSETYRQKGQEDRQSQKSQETKSCQKNCQKSEKKLSDVKLPQRKKSLKGYHR